MTRPLSRQILDFLTFTQVLANFHKQNLLAEIWAFCFFYFPNFAYHDRQASHLDLFPKKGFCQFSWVSLIWFARFCTLCRVPTILDSFGFFWIFQKSLDCKQWSVFPSPLCLKDVWEKRTTKFALSWATCKVCKFVCLICSILDALVRIGVNWRPKNVSYESPEEGGKTWLIRIPDRNMHTAKFCLEGGGMGDPPLSAMSPP